MEDLLIATNNRGKLKELEDMIAGLPVRLRTLSDVGISDEIDETGDTFADNANLKAAGYAKLSGLPTLADDSGLEIDHLNGRPGVMSARYAGDGASDQDRIIKVLEEMRSADENERTARFQCAISLANTNGDIVACVEGICEGRITNVPRGGRGFGYDPIFVPDGYAETFAELDAKTKNRISHRGLAIAKIIPFLQGFVEI
jgi:XTP/dITP diphosphohydrolase